MHDKENSCVVGAALSVHTTPGQVPGSRVFGFQRVISHTKRTLVAVLIGGITLAPLVFKSVGYGDEGFPELGVLGLKSLDVLQLFDSPTLLVFDIGPQPLDLGKERVALVGRYADVGVF